MKHKLLKLILVFSMLSIAFSQLYVANSLLESQKPTVLPIGAKDVVIYRFVVSTNATDIWRSLSFQILNPSFASHWSKIKIYKDTNRNSVLDASEKSAINNVNADIYTAGMITINNIDQNFNVYPTQAYYIAVDISATTDISTVLQITPNQFLDDTGTAAIISSNIKGYSFPLSRLYSSISKTVTENYFIGNNELNLFNIDLRLSGDLKCLVTFDFNINYKNQGYNIGEIRIYLDDNLIVTAELKSISNYIISLPDDPENLISTTTRNISIRYYNNSYGDTGISFNIKINNIVASYGDNNAMGYQYTVLEELPSKNIQLTGVYPNISVIPISSRYVGGPLPVFNINLNSYFMNSTLNTIELMSTGDFMFSNNDADNVIKHVLVYFNNSVILTVSVGSYDIINDDTIRITLNRSIANFFNNSSVALTVSYVLTNSILEAKKLETKITNITYFTDVWNYHDLDNLLVVNASSYFNMLGEAIVRLEGYFVTSNHKIIFPRGGTYKEIAYLDFSYNGVDVFDSRVVVNTIVIENKGSLSIDKLRFKYIYDSNGNKQIDITDSPIINSPYLIYNIDTTANRVTINNSNIQLDVSVNINGYFLMMEVLPTADTGLDNINLSVPDFLYYRYYKLTTDDFKGVMKDAFIGETISISVTGLKMTQEKSPFPLPFMRDEKFTLATFSIISLVEFTREINFNLEIKTLSPYSLGTIYIVKDYTGDPLNNITTIATINEVVSKIVNISDVSYIPITADQSEITRNYKFIYYPNINRDAGVTFDLIIKDIVGTSYPVNYTTNCFDDNLTANFGLSGLKITLDSALVTGTYTTIMDIPVFRCEYGAFYDNVTFNGLSLVISSNDFKFTSSGDENRIKQISIYRDINDNSVWDDDDTLLAEYEMSSAKLSEIYLTINQLVISGSANSDLFLIYQLSTYQDIDTPLLAKSSIDKYYFVHSGDIKVITANKTNLQEVTLEQAKYIFTPGLDLFTTINFEGAYNVPILSFKLRSTQLNIILSYNIILETNRNLYSNNDRGIKSVMLMEDVDYSNSYTSEDKVLDIIHDFSNTGRRLTLNIKNIYPNDHNYLVLYNLGQKMSDISNISSEILRPKLYAIAATTTVSVKTAGLFPYPRNNRYMSFIAQGLGVELIRLTPDKWITGNLSVQLRLTNRNTAPITVNSVYPQFYEAGLSSLNVTYLYNIATTLNFPFTLNTLEQRDILFTVSTDIESQSNQLFLDALVEYQLFAEQIRLQRRDIFEWQRLLTANQSLDIEVPESAIFYLDFPTYIQRVLRSKSALAFLNGDIIGNDEYLIVYLKDTLSNIDTNKILVKLDGVTLNMYSSEPNYRYDNQSNSIRIGRYVKGAHKLIIKLYDNAGNMYPETQIDFSVYDPDQFYIKDLLVYPSRKSQDSIIATPLKIGFQLSKSCEVQLYLFNSRGEKVWSDKYDASLVNNYYQLRDFDGILDNGQLIPKGMYILKTIIIDNGKKIDA
ncbi:MAG: hypothetical protein WCH76_01845, partial [Candidatus Riflemargulisbacteria bacterium]